MTNWEALNVVEKIVVKIIEVAIKLSRSEKRILSLKIVTYKLYKNALERNEKSQLAR